MSIESSLSDAMASSMASSIGYMFSGSHAPSPNDRIKHEIFGTSKVQHRPFTEQTGLKYDSVKNQVTTYLVDADPSSTHVFKRSFMGKAELEDSESQVGLAQSMNVSEYGGIDDFYVGYESEHHVLSHPRENKQQMVLFARDEKKSWSHQLMETVEHVWKAVVAMLRKVGIAMRRALDWLSSKIPWDDISHTTAFLSLFYKKLGTLSLNGFDMARDLFRSTLKNATTYTQNNLFKNVIENLGAHNISYEQSMKYTDRFSNITNDLSTDANTAMIQDRVVNNLQHITIDYANKSIMDRLVKVCHEAGSSVRDAFNISEINKLNSLNTDLPNYNSLMKANLGAVLKFMRNLAVTSEHVAGNLFASIMQFVPFYWNLALEFMNVPINVRFLYDFWTKKVRYCFFLIK